MRLTLISRRNQMNTAQPIRNREDLKNFKNYYKEIRQSQKSIVSDSWLEYCTEDFGSAYSAVERCLQLFSKQMAGAY